jgi:hypothetical protein
MGKTIFEAAMERALDRREFSYTAHIPERRRGMEAIRHTKEELKIKETRNALLLLWERLRVIRDMNQNCDNSSHHEIATVQIMTSEGLDHGIDDIEYMLKNLKENGTKKAPETETS